MPFEIGKQLKIFLFIQSVAACQHQFLHFGCLLILKQRINEPDDGSALFLNEFDESRHVVLDIALLEHTNERIHILFGDGAA